MKKLNLDFGKPINENQELVISENTSEETPEETSEEEPADIEEPTSEEAIENDEPEEEESKEIKYNKDDFRISTIVPFSMSVTDYPDDPKQKMASLFYIVRSKSGAIITLYTAYLLENEEEVEQIKHNYPFHVENNFASFRIASNLIINSYYIFATDFNFKYDESIENYKFSIKAIRQDADGMHETVEFTMISDVFASIKYIDSYAYELTRNDYELSIASLAAVDDVPNTNPSAMRVVNKIDRIVAMAQISNSTTYAIEYILNTDDDKQYTMLSTFNLGEKFNKKKFKGMTVDKLQHTYLLEADQYIQLFADYCRFTNIDKEYLILKGRNKDNNNILFMFDSTIRAELESMIGDY